MGITSSSLDTVQQNRLLKPKTNSNTISKFSDRYGNDYYAAPAPARWQFFSPYRRCVASESLLVDNQCHPNNQAHIQAEPCCLKKVIEGDDLSPLASHLTSQLSCLSRTGSFASGDRVSTKRSANSAVVSNISRSINYETVIAILREIKQMVSPEDFVALRDALSPGKLKEQISNAASQPYEDPAYGSCGALIRRRSMAIPGLATRLREPVTRPSHTCIDMPNLNEDHIWNLDIFNASPLTQFSSLDIKEEKQKSIIPRAQTPGCIEYSNLGSLAYGSLHITNGAASPTPSAVKTSPLGCQSAQAEEQEDYFNPLCSQRRVPQSMSASALPLDPRSNQGDISPFLATKAIYDPENLDIETSKGLAFSGEDTFYEANNYPTSDHKNKLCDARDFRRALDLAEYYRTEIMANPFTNQESLDGDLPSRELSYLSPLASDGNGTIGTFDGQGLVDFNAEVFDIRNVTPLTEEFKIHPTSWSERLRSGTASRCETDLKMQPCLSESDSGYYSGVSLEEQHSRMSDEISRYGRDRYEGHEPLLQCQKEPKSEDSHFNQAFTTNENLLRLTFKRAKTSWYAMPVMSFIGTTALVAANKFGSNGSQKQQRKLRKRQPRIGQLPIMQSPKPIPVGSMPCIRSEVANSFSRRISSCSRVEHLVHDHTSIDHTYPTYNLVKPFCYNAESNPCLSRSRNLGYEGNVCGPHHSANVAQNLPTAT